MSGFLIFHFWPPFLSVGAFCDVVASKFVQSLDLLVLLLVVFVWDPLGFGRMQIFSTIVTRESEYRSSKMRGVQLEVSKELPQGSLACCSLASIATLLFDHSMSVLPIIDTHKSQRAGLFACR